MAWLRRRQLALPPRPRPKVMLRIHTNDGLDLDYVTRIRAAIKARRVQTDLTVNPGRTGHG